jgi:hypothetical protein
VTAYNNLLNINGDKSLVDKISLMSFLQNVFDGDAPKKDGCTELQKEGTEASCRPAALRSLRTLRGQYLPSPLAVLFMNLPYL